MYCLKMHHKCCIPGRLTRREIHANLMHHTLMIVLSSFSGEQSRDSRHPVNRSNNLSCAYKSLKLCPETD